MTDLFVHEFGNPDAPPLVLVHGLTDDGTCWPDAVARWESEWRILAVDQRGHGESPRFTAEQIEKAPTVLEADLADVLNGLGEPAVVVGHSLGGLMAARVAVKHPALVRGLVLEDPARPRGEGTPESDIARQQFSREQIAFVDAVTVDPEGELARMRRETPWSETELLPWAQAKAKVDRTYLRHGLFLGSRAWEGMFDLLTMPTLIVVPVEGEMAPDPDLIANPLVRVVEIPEAGHCIRRDNPAGFHGVVDPFLVDLRG